MFAPQELGTVLVQGTPFGGTKLASTSELGLKHFYRNHQWHKCMLIIQTHTKHRLTAFTTTFNEVPWKNIYSTNMENNDNYIYSSLLLPAALCSFLSLDNVTLQVFIRDLIRLLFSFSHVNCAFPSPLSQNLWHTTKTSLIVVSSIHRLLTFVNATNKDIAVSCFRVSAAGANATKWPEGEIGSLGTTMLSSLMSTDKDLLESQTLDNSNTNACLITSNC